MNTDSFRKRKCTYSIISNQAIDDDSLTPQAYYIYSKICRYITLQDASDFVLTKAFLFNKCNMTEKTFDKYWKELLNQGYLKIYQVPDRNNKGKLITEYELLEIADLNTPYFVIYKADGTIAKELYPKPKDKTVIKKDYKKSYGNVKEKVNSTVPPILGGTVKAGDGKMGGLLNTNKANTNKINTKSSSSKEEIEEDVCKKISSKCMKNNLKLSTKQVTKLMNLYDNMEVLRAIESAIEAIEEGTEVKAPYGYVKRIIENAKKISVTNIHIDKTKKPGFNNFTQREKTQEEYDELEQELLGWYDN